MRKLRMIERILFFTDMINAHPFFDYEEGMENIFPIPALISYIGATF
jgi:hypothetical protein